MNFYSFAKAIYLTARWEVIGHSWVNVGRSWVHKKSKTDPAKAYFAEFYSAKFFYLVHPV